MNELSKKILYLCDSNKIESMPQTDNNINFDDLFRYNYRPLCLYALHYLQDVDLSEDIVQESYAALWEKLQEGAQILNRKSYL